MTTDELKSVVEAELRASQGWVGGEVSEKRRQALDYYYGEPFGNEIEGQSEYVSMDVQDVIEAMIPDLMDIFASGDVVVEFQPFGPEDEALARQATDYINHIWLHDNDGFGVSHDWIKDALLQKNGIIRIDWDDTPEVRTEHLTKVNHMALAQILEDETVEILEQAEAEPAGAVELQYANEAPLFDIKLRKTFTRGRVVIQSLPPEEFLISRRATDLDDANLTCHKRLYTISDLRKMGYPDSLLENLPGHDEQDYNEERISRFNLDDEWPLDSDSPDEALREIWVYDCYLRVDMDGDGIAEFRNVMVAGSSYEILPDPQTGEDALEVDDHPFVSITPIRVPHKFFGRSLFEIVADIQFIKSTITRQLLNNMYLANNQRSAVSSRVNLDDYLTNRPGGVVRVNTPGSDVAGHIVPLPSATIGSFAYPLLEYMDGTREIRTGITRYNQGLDADSLNKTATGINLLLNQTQKRLLMIARLFAETGFKQAFKKILRLTINNQDFARVVRLRGEWVPIDPRAWNADMDLQVRVGLGHGTKESRVQALTQVLALQDRAIELQGGVKGPLVDLRNVWEAVRASTNAAGLRPASLYFTEPTPEVVQQLAQQPEQPDPKVQEIELEHQREMKKMDLEAEREQRRLQMDLQIKVAELELEAMSQGIKINAERLKAAIDAVTQRQKVAADAQLARDKASADVAIKRQTARDANGGAESAA